MLSLRPPPDVAPLLVLAVGNPSRGDDALGPLAAERLAALALPGVEVLTDFQLQVEHALDLLGRRRVVFVDAAASGAAPFELRPLAPAAQVSRAAPGLPRSAASYGSRNPSPAADASFSSHSLSPAAVLDTYRRLTGGEPPPSMLLAIRGHDFALGAPLSTAAAANLHSALAALTAILRQAPEERPLDGPVRAGAQAPA